MAYGDKCFAQPTVHVWYKKMLHGQKFASDTEVQSIIVSWTATSIVGCNTHSEVGCHTGQKVWTKL